MDSLELRSGLVNHTFAGNNWYNFGDRRYLSYTFHPHYMKELPVVAYNAPKEGEAYEINVPNDPSFRDKNLTKDKLIEVLSTSQYLQKVKFNRKYYYAAQGFLAEEQDPFDNIIFLHSVNRLLTREEVEPEDINLYINNKYTSNPEYKKEQIMIKEFFNICKGNITYTKDPLQKFEQRLVFRSKTIQGLKRELNRHIAPILAELKSESVKTVVEYAKQDLELEIVLVDDTLD